MEEVGEPNVDGNMTRVMYLLIIVVTSIELLIEHKIVN